MLNENLHNSLKVFPFSSYSSSLPLAWVTTSNKKIAPGSAARYIVNA